MVVSLYTAKNVLNKYALLDKDRIDLFRRPRYRLFKTLVSSACRLDCHYCPLSRYCRFERTQWNTDDLVKTFIANHRSGRVNGLFLTSTLYSDPDRVVEKEIEIVEKIRMKGYKGYIHLRLMPGVSKDLLFHAAVHSDRIGLNVEAPKDVFKEIAPSKGDWIQDIVKRIEWLISIRKRFRRISRGYGYVSRGVDTQFVLGASDETDLEVLETAWMLIKMGIDRIYISGFKPYKNTPLEYKNPSPKWRVLRITQAIKLMRVYGFTFNEIKDLANDHGMLPNIDPKILYADKNKDLYPIDLNQDPYELIVKVPGIGPKSAKAIIKIREQRGRVTRRDLVKIIGYGRLRKAIKYISVPG